jgi:hypothetical protein
MHGLGTIIAMNAKQAGREAALALNDGDERLSDAIHTAAIEHAPSKYCGECDLLASDHIVSPGVVIAGGVWLIDHEFVIVGASRPRLDGPDVNDLSYVTFTNGFLEGRKDG